MTKSSDRVPVIMVVDDSGAIRSVVRMVLADEGYEVREAAAGAEALEALRERDADVILVDLGLPGISGLEVMQRYRSEGDGKGRVVAFTASASIPEELAQRVDAVLRKPFEIEDLVDLVKRLVG